VAEVMTVWLAECRCH